jgi:ATP-dependent Clp protease ATP-binding subunit ClpA
MKRLLRTLGELLIAVVRGALTIWQLDRILFFILVALAVAPVIWVWSNTLGMLYGPIWVLLVIVKLLDDKLGIETRVTGPSSSPVQEVVPYSTVSLKAISNEMHESQKDRPVWTQHNTDLSPGLLENLGKTLSRLKGQDTAVNLIIKSLKRRSVGISDRSRPLSFLLVGPTGVGKTEMAKLTAKGLGRKLEQFDVGQLGKEGSHSNAQGSGWTLFGSPQGFIGGEGKLTSTVLANPTCVILFDEIEKGSPELLDLFLAILDEGGAKDNRTNAVVNFSDCIIFFTSNLIAEIPPEICADLSNMRGLVLETGFFRPEMINRISHVIPMRPLDLKVRQAITRDLIEHLLNKVVRPGGRKVVDDPAVVDAIVKKSDPRFGARDLQRVLDEIVGNPLTDALFDRADANAPEHVIVRISGGRVHVEVA